MTHVYIFTYFRFFPPFFLCWMCRIEVIDVHTGCSLHNHRGSCCIVQQLHDHLKPHDICQRFSTLSDGQLRLDVSQQIIAVLHLQPGQERLHGPKSPLPPLHLPSGPVP